MSDKEQQPRRGAMSQALATAIGNSSMGFKGLGGVIFRCEACNLYYYVGERVRGACVDCHRKNTGESK